MRLRWDLGKEPKDGAVSEYYSQTGRRFDGTQFAMLFDRRWQFIATWEGSTLDPEMWNHYWLLNVCNHGFHEGTPLSLRRRRELQAEAVTKAAGWAEHLLSVEQMDGCEMVLREESMVGTCHEWFACNPRVLRETLKQFSSPLPTPELRADWLIEGCFRWQMVLPQSYEEVVGLVTASVNQKDPGALTESEVDSECRRLRLVNPIKHSIQRLGVEWISVSAKEIRDDEFWVGE